MTGSGKALIAVMRSFQETFPSSYVSVAQARHAVADFAQRCGLTPIDIADIELAGGEAFNNAAEHGHVEGGSFQVSCQCNGERFVLIVSDSGRGFRLAGLGQAVPPEKRGARGLGIFLMRSMMDEVDYTITSRGTEVRLTKRYQVSNISNSGRSTAQRRGATSAI